MSAADKPVHLVITEKDFFSLIFEAKHNLTRYENVCFRSTKLNMSSKIVGWLVGDFKKILKEEKKF